MIIKAGDLLRLVTSAAMTVDVSVHYIDSGPNRLPANGNTAITTATTTTICPGSLMTGTARVIRAVHIRNKDTGPTNVTVTLAGFTMATATTASTAVTVEIYKATLAAGGELHYDENVGWYVTTPNPIGVASTLIVAANVANANATPDTLADITGLTFAVLNGKTYRFRASIAFTSAATTTGARFTINGPTMTGINFVSRWTLTANTEFFGYHTALLGGAVQASALTTGNMATIEGLCTPSADGTLAVQFSSEITVSAITALAGSTLDYMRVL